MDRWRWTVGAHSDVSHTKIKFRLWLQSVMERSLRERERERECQSKKGSAVEPQMAATEMPPKYPYRLIMHLGLIKCRSAYTLLYASFCLAASHCYFKKQLLSWY